MNSSPSTQALYLIAAGLLLITPIGCRQQDAKTPPTDAATSTHAATRPRDIPALRAELHEAVSTHRVLTYRKLWEALAYTDEDPDHPGNVVLLYTGWSRSSQDHGNGQSQWNREHVWAKSRGDFGTRPGPGTDLHLIRATDVSMNGARSNLAFDDGGELVIDGDGATRCRRDGDSWEPRDAVKGDIARMLFYTAIRYEDAPDLELSEDAPSRGDKAPLHGVRSTLLRWHALDPVDDLERRRHERIAEVQGNRNPFIDRPELAAMIWGDEVAGETGQ